MRFVGVVWLLVLLQLSLARNIPTKDLGSDIVDEKGTNGETKITQDEDLLEDTLDNSSDETDDGPGDIDGAIGDIEEADSDLPGQINDDINEAEDENPGASEAIAIGGGIDFVDKEEPDNNAESETAEATDALNAANPEVNADLLDPKEQSELYKELKKEAKLEAKLEKEASKNENKAGETSQIEENNEASEEGETENSRRRRDLSDDDEEQSDDDVEQSDDEEIESEETESEDEDGIDESDDIEEGAESEDDAIEQSEEAEIEEEETESESESEDYEIEQADGEEIEEEETESESEDAVDDSQDVENEQFEEAAESEDEDGIDESDDIEEGAESEDDAIEQSEEAENEGEATESEAESEDDEIEQAGGEEIDEEEPEAEDTVDESEDVEVGAEPEDDEIEQSEQSEDESMEDDSEQSESEDEQSENAVEEDSQETEEEDLEQSEGADFEDENDFQDSDESEVESETGDEGGELESSEENMDDTEEEDAEEEAEEDGDDEIEDDGDIDQPKDVENVFESDIEELENAEKEALQEEIKKSRKLEDNLEEDEDEQSEDDGDIDQTKDVENVFESEIEELENAEKEALQEEIKKSRKLEDNLEEDEDEQSEDDGDIDQTKDVENVFESEIEELENAEKEALQEEIKKSRKSDDNFEEEEVEQSEGVEVESESQEELDEAEELENSEEYVDEQQEDTEEADEDEEQSGEAKVGKKCGGTEERVSEREESEELESEDMVEEEFEQSEISEDEEYEESEENDEVEDSDDEEEESEEIIEDEFEQSEEVEESEESEETEEEEELEEEYEEETQEEEQDVFEESEDESEAAEDGESNESVETEELGDFDSEGSEEEFEDTEEKEEESEESEEEEESEESEETEESEDTWDSEEESEETEEEEFQQSEYQSEGSEEEESEESEEIEVSEETEEEELDQSEEFEEESEDAVEEESEESEDTVEEESEEAEELEDSEYESEDYSEESEESESEELEQSEEETEETVEEESEDSEESEELEDSEDETEEFEEDEFEQLENESEDTEDEEFEQSEESEDESEEVEEEEESEESVEAEELEDSEDESEETEETEEVEDSEESEYESDETDEDEFEQLEDSESEKIEESEESEEAEELEESEDEEEESEESEEAEELEESEDEEEESEESEEAEELEESEDEEEESEESEEAEELEESEEAEELEESEDEEEESEESEEAEELEESEDEEEESEESEEAEELEESEYEEEESEESEEAEELEESEDEEEESEEAEVLEESEDEEEESEESEEAEELEASEDEFVDSEGSEEDESEENEEVEDSDEASMEDMDDLESSEDIYRRKRDAYPRPPVSTLFPSTTYVNKSFIEVVDNNKKKTKRSAPLNIRHRRYIVPAERARWDRGIVPFEFNTVFNTPESQLEQRAAMLKYQTLTCIRFVPNDKNTKEKYGLDHDGVMELVSETGCWAVQGNTRGRQKNSCCGKVICLHELGHTLGLIHEHQSDLRSGWIRINWANINPNYKIWFVDEKTTPESSLVGYDITSNMHYSMHAFSSNGKAVMTQLYRGPQFKVKNSDFYTNKEISLSHKCGETYCSTFDMECVNEGYLTLVRDECSCSCPPGLEPSTGCADIKKQAVMKIWPRGTYSIIRPESGCPKGFKDGTVVIHATKAFKSSFWHLGKGYNGPDVEFQFCTSDKDNTNDVPWEPGVYCILRKGGKCPAGFIESFIQYGETKPPKTSGVVPDGVFDKQTRLFFCCRSDGFENLPILLPNTEPFALVAHGASCQIIAGMGHQEEYFVVQNKPMAEVEGLGFPTNVEHPNVKFNKAYGTIRLQICYYHPVTSGCGDIIELTDDSPSATITSPGYPGNYPNNIECNWLIKGPEHLTIKLDFEEFDVEGTTQCLDYLEIRQNRIGQTGVKYCGSHLTTTVRSVYQNMSMTFRTNSENTKKGFKAKIQLVRDKDYVYNPLYFGSTYRGKVNFTHLFEPCIPWAEATQCEHHPLQTGDYEDDLIENYCRNPDKGIMPWCYTSADDCSRNYCDVSLIGKLHNNFDDCEEVIQEDPDFCKRDIALQGCGVHCSELISMPKKEKSYLEVSCKEPQQIQDSELTEQTKTSYDEGDTVTYKCKTSDLVYKSTCMSDGSWTPVKYVCGGCPYGWVEYKTDCYKYYDTLVKIKEAKEKCAENNATLTTVLDQEEEDFLVSLRKTMHKIMIGLEKKDGKWVWPDGSEATWLPWERPPFDRWDYKYAILLGQDKGRKFVATNGYWRREFVCKRSIQKRETCLDRLNTCEQTMTAIPSACQNEGWSRSECPVSCNICQISDKKCDVGSVSTGVKQNGTVNSLKIGEYVSYYCDSGYTYVAGNKDRVCLRSGKLSGEPYQCKLTTTLPYLNNNVPLSNYRLSGWRGWAHTGLSDALKISVNGKIAEWQFYSRTKGKVAFLVFRPLDTPLKMDLIGRNFVKTRFMRQQYVTVKPEDRIEVRAGDVLGLYPISGSGIPMDSGCSGPKSLRLTTYLWNSDSISIGNTYTFVQEGQCKLWAFRAKIIPNKE